MIQKFKYFGFGKILSKYNSENDSTKILIKHFVFEKYRGEKASLHIVHIFNLEDLLSMDFVPA